MLAILAVVVLGLATAAYEFWAKGLAGYDQLKFLPVIAATFASLLAIGLRAVFLVLQDQGIQLSTSQRAVALALSFGVFAVLFVMNM